MTLPGGPLPRRRRYESLTPGEAGQIARRIKYGWNDLFTRTAVAWD